MLKTSVLDLEQNTFGKRWLDNYIDKCCALDQVNAVRHGELKRKIREIWNERMSMNMCVYMFTGTSPAEIIVDNGHKRIFHCRA